MSKNKNNTCPFCFGKDGKHTKNCFRGNLPEGRKLKDLEKRKKLSQENLRKKYGKV